MLTPRNPLKGKEKRNTADSNYCKKCVQYGSKIGSDNSLFWINSNAKNCKYWVHLYYTGLSCKDEDEEMFAKITKYFCKRHNSYTLL